MFRNFCVWIVVKNAKANELVVWGLVGSFIGLFVYAIAS